MAGDGNSEEEGKGFFATVWDGIKAFFFAIFKVFEFIFNVIYYTIYYILQCFEFIWYPIKENCRKCCNWCSSKQSRSQDPHFSTFDNEV